jgi:hypothetical protein
MASLKSRGSMRACLCALALASTTNFGWASPTNPNAINSYVTGCEALGSTTCYDVILGPPGRVRSPEVFFTTTPIPDTSLTGTSAGNSGSSTGTSSGEADFALLGTRASVVFSGVGGEGGIAQADFFDEFHFGGGSTAIIRVTAGATGSISDPPFSLAPARILMVNSTSTALIVGGVPSKDGEVVDGPGVVTAQIAVKPGDVVDFLLGLNVEAGVPPGGSNATVDFLDPLMVTAVSAVDAAGNPVPFTFVDAHGHSLVAPISVPEPATWLMSTLGLVVLLVVRRSHLHGAHCRRPDSSHAPPG